MVVPFQLFTERAANIYWGIFRFDNEEIFYEF